MSIRIFQIPLFLLWILPLTGQIRINEFMASNGSAYADPFGNFDDWVELYNAGTSAVNIAGMYVTDDLSDPTKYQIPAGSPSVTTIPGGGFLLLWFDDQTSQGANHVTPKLSAGGEAIGLFQSDGASVVDSITFGAQFLNISYGRTSDGGSTFNFFATSTPNASNNGAVPGLPAANPPVFSVTGGLKSGPVALSLSSTTPGASIYYTLNGAEPANTSTLYTGPVQINTNTSLRAIAYASGMQPSAIISNTYIFNAVHTFPVIAMSVDPLAMFDPATGMYPNYEEDIAIPCNLEMYESNGSTAFNQVLETEIQGTASAALPQKSLAIKAKSALGSATINYPVYNSLPFTQYRSLNLRNSGQDWNYTMFRDAMATSLVHDLSDMNGIIDQPKVHTSAYRPSVVYINGEYWGIHNVRERADWRYLKVHFDLDEDEVDIISEENEIEEGTIDEWNSFQNYLSSQSFTTTPQLEALSQKADIEEYMDYIIFNLYIDNTDWPSNNNRRWREKASDGKWRWFLKDLDFTFGLFQLGGGWNTGDATQNSLERLFNSTGYNWPNAAWSTLLFRKLIENPVWKRDFINRMADQMNTLYQPNRVNNRISSFQTTYEPEMQRHFNKWNGGWSGSWIPNINLMRSFANNRLTHLRTHFDNQFSEINGTCSVSVSTQPAGKGTVEISTLHLTNLSQTWNGVYFRGVPVPVKATPNRGFVFTGWSPANLGNSATSTLSLNSTTYNLIAQFAAGSASTQPVIINEINYNSQQGNSSGDWVELYNPNAASVNISGWYLQDDSGGYFSFPANTSIPPLGFMVIVEDSVRFKTQYPGIPFSGHFGSGLYSFELSGGGEPLALYNANHVTIDTVRYDDIAPWPESPDGNGPSLQLIAPDMNNNIGNNWAGWNPTPNAPNSQNPVQQSQLINFPAIPDMLTSYPPYTLNATASSGLPVSYSILSGPATVTGQILTLNGQPGAVTVQASQTGNAQFLAAPPVVRTFQVTAPGGYCSLTGNLPQKQWISQVVYGAINNSTGIDHYGDYSALSTVVQGGSSTVITLTTGFTPSNTYNMYWRVWIDYNHNGTFDSPGEIAFQGVKPAPPVGTLSASLTGTINIPATALSGATRMRVTMRRNQYAPACGIFSYGECEDYTVVITGGGTAAELTLTCPPNLTVNTAPGATSAVAIYSLPVATTNCNITGTQLTLLSGLNSGTSFPVGITTVVYRATDNCNNSKTCQFNVTVVATPPPADYCTASASAPWLQWISNVTLGNINQNSAKSNYSNFTSQSTTLLSNQTYQITLKSSFSWTTYNSYWKVWIDYNHNQIFEEPSEVAVQYIKLPPPNGTPSATAQVMFTVPSDVLNGSTRMRVALRRDGYAAPCGAYELGEVEDYSIQLVSGWEWQNVASTEPEWASNEKPAFTPASTHTHRVFPNPAIDRLHIWISADQPLPDTYWICDQTGRVVQRGNWPAYPISDIAEIPVDDLPSGMYYLILQSQEKEAIPIHLKFIKCDMD